LINGLVIGIVQPLYQQQLIRNLPRREFREEVLDGDHPGCEGRLAEQVGKVLPEVDDGPAIRENDHQLVELSVLTYNIGRDLLKKSLHASRKDASAGQLSNCSGIIVLL